MLKSVDKFKIEKAPSAKLINIFSQSKIKILYLKKADKFLTVYTNYKDRARIIDLLNGLCYNYSIISVGAGKNFKNLLRRKGLVFGVLTAVVWLILAQNFCFRVEVSGGFKTEALAVLSDCGVSEGKWIRGFDAKLAASAITALNGVASASVERIGSTVKVNILAELPEEDVYYYSADKPVLSGFDAVVSRQIIFSGEAAKKNGEVVRRGDTLINNFLTVSESRVASPARGEVYGLVYYRASVSYNPNFVVVSKSGNKAVNKSVSFLGCESRPKQSPYKVYVAESVTRTSGFIFPIITTETTYWEMVEVQVNRPFSVAEGEVKANALAAAAEGLPEGAIIKNNWFTVSEADGAYLVEAVIEAEHRIDTNIA